MTQAPILGHLLVSNSTSGVLDIRSVWVQYTFVNICPRGCLLPIYLPSIVSDIQATLKMTQSNAPTHRYSQQLAQYTLRQFAMASAVLDEGKKERLYTLPGSHARILSTNGGVQGV